MACGTLGGACGRVPLWETRHGGQRFPRQHTQGRCCMTWPRSQRLARSWGAALATERQPALEEAGEVVAGALSVAMEEERRCAVVSGQSIPGRTGQWEAPAAGRREKGLAAREAWPADRASSGDAPLPSARMLTLGEGTVRVESRRQSPNLSTPPLSLCPLSSPDCPWRCTASAPATPGRRPHRQHNTTTPRECCPAVSELRLAAAQHHGRT